MDAVDVGGEAVLTDVDAADVEPSSYDKDGRRPATGKQPNIARSVALGIGPCRRRERERSPTSDEVVGMEIDGDWVTTRVYSERAAGRGGQQGPSRDRGRAG